MNHEPPIRSASNQIIKRVRALGAGRESDGLLLEGERLVQDALNSGFGLDLVLLSEQRTDWIERMQSHAVPFRLVESELLKRASSLQSGSDVLALGALPAPRRLDELGAQGVLPVLCGLSNPGNLGALARAAEAFGAEGLAVCQNSVSPWNSKALRGSMGSLLRLPVLHGCRAVELRKELSGRGYRQVELATRSGLDVRELGRQLEQQSEPVALWVGAEAGNGPELAGLEPITIPMNAQVESLNIAVALSVVLYECSRALGQAFPKP